MFALEKIHMKLINLRQPFLVEVVETNENKVLLRCGEMLFWAKDNSKKVLNKRFWAKVERVDDKVVLIPLPFRV